MKKFLFLTLSAIMALSMASCGSDDTPPAEEYNLTVAPTSLTFEAQDSNTKTITVTAENVEWEAAVENATENSWVSIQTDGDKISVTVSENTGDERKATITVTPKNTGKVEVRTTPSPPREITVTQKEYVEVILPTDYNLTMNTAYMNLLGNVDQKGYVVYEVALGDLNSKYYYDKDLDMARTDATDGYIVSFYFIGEEATRESLGGTILPDGEYKISKDYNGGATFEFEKNTFLKTFKAGTEYGGSLFFSRKNGKTNAAWMISDGTVTVKNLQDQNNTVDINIDLSFTDGSTLKATYKQPFNVRTTELWTSYTEDVDITDLTSIDGTYYEGAGQNSDLFFTLFYTQGITFDGSSIKGTGFVIRTEVYAPLGNGSTLPVGTYNITSTGQQYTVLYGFYVSDKLGGCWIYEYENSKIINVAPLMSGSFEVNKEGNNYTVTFDGLTDKMTEMKGTFTGEMVYKVGTVTKASSFVPQFDVYSFPVIR